MLPQQPRRARSVAKYAPVQRNAHETGGSQARQRRWRRRAAYCALLLIALGVGAIVAYLLVRYMQSSSSDVATATGTGAIANPNQTLNGTRAAPHSSSSSTGAFASQESSTGAFASQESSTGAFAPQESSTGAFASQESSTGESSSESGTPDASQSSTASAADAQESSSTGASDDLVFDPSVLQYAARYSANADPETGALLPELNQFPDTPCAIQPNTKSNCVMQIVVVFGEASSDSARSATRFDSQFKTYHWNANDEIVPYDFTSNLYGEFTGVQTISPVVDEYFALQDNEFNNVLVINALHSNTSQTDTEAWYPSGPRWRKLVRSVQAALSATAPGSSVVATLLHLPTRQSVSELESEQSVFLATNAIAALRQAALGGNSSALVLVDLPDGLEQKVLNNTLYTAPLSAGIASPSVVNMVSTELQASDFYVPLRGDLRIESTRSGAVTFYVDDDFNSVEPNFAQDDDAFGRYTALNVSRQSRTHLLVNADGIFSFNFESDPYYTRTGASTAWQVITPSYAVGVWVKRIDESSSIENGMILGTSRQAFDNQSPDLEDGSVDLRMRLLNATSIQVGHMVQDGATTQDPRGLTYNTYGSDLVQLRAWTHLLMSFDARPEQNLLRLYVNGTLAAEQTVLGWNGPSGSFRLGGVPGLPDQGASISGLCNLRIWNKPLDDNQALQVFALDEWQLPSAAV
jgi:hypothetical protein